MSRISLLTALVVSFVLFTFACGKQHTEDELYQMAQDFEKKGEIEKAISTYERQIDDYPKGRFADEATERAAFLCYNNIHDFSKAIQYHENLIRNYPESQFAAQARFMMGFIYANNLKDYEQAEHHYKEFLSKHPESELVESVKWELEHLGEDVGSQLDGLFGADNSNGGTRKN